MPLSRSSHSIRTMAVAQRTGDVRAAYDRMVEAMRERGRVLVAFSGGIDSGLVARIAHDALADNALAVLADAESLARRELEEAVAEASEIGIPLRMGRGSGLAEHPYLANPGNRRHLCPQELGAAP